MKTQKQLKDEYKQKKFRMGVFRIWNTVNGKLYVGSRLNLDAIWNRNRTELKLGGHRNAALQADWNAFGEDNFVFDVLFQLEPKESDQTNYGREVRELEKLYVDELQPFAPKGYHTPKAA